MFLINQQKNHPFYLIIPKNSSWQTGELDRKRVVWLGERHKVTTLGLEGVRVLVQAPVFHSEGGQR